MAIIENSPQNIIITFLIPIFAPMFKRLTSIVLLIALIASSFQRYMVYAGFELNHDYIAKNLCINRNRPWMHCNGKCYFMRKIAEAQENEKKQDAKDNLSRLEVSFFQDAVTFEFFKLPEIKEIPAHQDNYRCNYTNQYISSLFRPPKTTV
ncbi:hypothetical protein [Mucilaginibacter sp.]|uniref:hypothetical protein n=1 Tax=Mucilaginibacter sp. TaxID=1882438 RepID=UPI002852C1BF|nr:hypothetical protein [Mucilaginibacter sp.]